MTYQIHAWKKVEDTTVSYDFTVEANDENEAVTKAKETLNGGNIPWDDCQLKESEGEPREKVSNVGL